MFFGPVRFTEQIVSAAVGAPEEAPKPLSPLSAKEIAELFKEANTVVQKLKIQKEKATKKKRKSEPLAKKLGKMSVLDKSNSENKSPVSRDSETGSPLSPRLTRRGTFKVKNSPIDVDFLPRVDSQPETKTEVKKSKNESKENSCNKVNQKKLPTRKSLLQRPVSKLAAPKVAGSKLLKPGVLSKVS